ncbi:MAG: ferritin family protein [Deltaproteobacteria bacterium]|nr:ferritin family protein [Deltaproteobacteria bacterium]
MFSAREIYHLAIQIEKNGETFYREALEKISNPVLRELIVWIADQELEHEEWFSKKMAVLEEKADDLDLEEIGHSILQNILGDQSFSLKEADLFRMDNLEDLLRLAIEFENDTILFYEMIGSLVDDEETSKKLQEIIKEERHHIELLQGFEDKENGGKGA